MHLIAFVCCIGCLALTDVARADETGQILLTLKETHNTRTVQKRQTELYPFRDLGNYAENTFDIQPIRLQYAHVPPGYQKFVNETLRRVSPGICSKEVP